MPKNKKFIDRKHAVTFHLVHRSQQDPLTADESAPQRVLLPIKEKPSKGDEKLKEEQQKYGIFFDDDYNYLQHLRDANTISVDWEKVEDKPSNLNLPSSVFASKVEENVGLLNKAAPSGLRLDLDPDIIAALDDDFDHENPDNELEDNFMELAGSEDGESDYSSDEERDEIGSLCSFRDEETKSRFTDYSMSSSVIRRNEQLTLLDDRFEKMFEAYDSAEIGPLDCEEIDGFVDPNSEMVLQCADEFHRQRQRQKLDKPDKINYELFDESDDDLVKIDVEEVKDKWDCESILSTYSNIYNHPKLITEESKIKINLRTGIPTNILGKNKLTQKNLQSLNTDFDKSVGSFAGRSMISQLSNLSIRPKHETPEERKERKQQLKEYRKCRREEKKANVEAFKDEAKRQNKIAINNRNNIQGNRIL